MVQGSSAAATTTGVGDVTVTFSGAAAFTNNRSYVCNGRDSNTSAPATVTYTSGTSVTFSVFFNVGKCVDGQGARGRRQRCPSRANTPCPGE